MSHVYTCVEILQVVEIYKMLSFKERKSVEEGCIISINFCIISDIGDDVYLRTNVYTVVSNKYIRRERSIYMSTSVYLHISIYTI